MSDAPDRPVIDLPMPKLGLTMTEGVVAEWKVAADEAFAAGDILFVVETEKIASEVAAEVAGVLDAILVAAGETAPVGAAVARIAPSGEAGAASAPASAMPPPPSMAVAASGPPSPAAKIDVVSRAPGARIVATPFARRLARDGDIDLAAVAGSGPRGRIKASDVRAASRAARAAPAPPVQDAATAPFHLFTDADIGALLALCAEIDSLGHGPSIGVTPFVVAAVARALADRPELNAVWRGGALVPCPAIDVAVAIGTPRGLVAPCLRDVDRKAAGAIAGELDAAAARAREAALAPGEMVGGSIAVSNLGAHAVTHHAPVLDPGRSFVLGVGRVRDRFRPDGEGRPVLRRELGLVLAADPRIADGAAAATLLDGIIDNLETPLRLLMLPA